METRPTPTGFQHALELRLRNSPARRFIDPLSALSDLEIGMTQPMVEVLEELPDGTRVRVSVFSNNAEPSPQEVAAIDGLAAELRFADANRL